MTAELVHVPRTVHGIRERSFEASAIDRGPEGPVELQYTTLRTVDAYKSILPKFNEEENFYERVLSLSEDGEAPIRVLDIGCGQGHMLAGLVGEFPSVQAFGLSAYDYRSLAMSVFQDDLVKVDYRVGDAHKLLEVFSDQEFDVITSVHCVEYLADPLAVLKQAYRKLAQEESSI